MSSLLLLLCNYNSSLCRLCSFLLGFSHLLCLGNLCLCISCLGLGLCASFNRLGMRGLSCSFCRLCFLGRSLCSLLGLVGCNISLELFGFYHLLCISFLLLLCLFISFKGFCNCLLLVQTVFGFCRLLLSIGSLCFCHRSIFSSLL